MDIKDIKIEDLYIIGFGLGGGFGGIDKYQVVHAVSQAEAEREAFNLACEEYDSYDGMYGLRTVEEIMEEDELNREDAVNSWRDERDSWLDYSAEKWSKELEGKVSCYHYENEFTEFTGKINEG